MEDLPVYPKAVIRRFDVFAEYNKLTRMEEGEPEDEAEGYGLWVAKVVASRRFSHRPKEPKKHLEPSEKRAEKAEGQPWHELDGQPQTSELFENEIVERMGHEFYRKVFEPSIKEAIDKGKSYEAIRDSIRKDWKPVRGKVSSGGK